MKRARLFFSSLLILVFVICSLARAGWLYARHGQSDLSGELTSFQGAQDPLVSSSARDSSVPAPRPGFTNTSCSLS